MWAAPLEGLRGKPIGERCRRGGKIGVRAVGMAIHVQGPRGQPCNENEKGRVKYRVLIKFSGKSRYEPEVN